MENDTGFRFFNTILSCLRLLLLIGITSTLLGQAAAAEPIRILALGDSLTAGYGLAANESFPAQLERELNARGIAVQVINAGVSGDTTAGGLARLDWALSDRPDAVILALGANDGLRAIDPALTRANLAAILDKLSTRNLPVLLAGIYAPPNLGKEYETEFNRIFPDLAAEYDTLLYPFFLAGIATNPALNQEDGIHPTALGVTRLVQQILPYVMRLLQRLPS